MNMNTFTITLILTLMLGFTAFATAVSQSKKKDRPTKISRYQTGTYLTDNGTKLRVNIDKELGGKVTIQFNDLQGNVYFDRMLKPSETGVRLSLDLTDLADGNYLLNISNGLQTVVRPVKITTREPTIATRSITML